MTANIEKTITKKTMEPIVEVKDIDTCMDQFKILNRLYEEAQKQFVEEQKIDNDKYVNCIQRASSMIKFLDDTNQFVINRYKEEVKKTYFISAELLIRTVGLNTNRKPFTDNEKKTLYISIAHIRKCLNIEPFHKQSQELFKMVLLFLTIHNPNVKENLALLNQILMVEPCDYQLHYNLGFMFHRDNNLDSSLYHYKLAIGLIDKEIELLKKDNKDITMQNQFKVKCLNGLGSIYFTIQDRETALYFFKLAQEIDPLDPDINNQIGVVYTELRYTDKAIEHYEKGIENYKRAQISVDKDMLIASMYMNMGLAKCYECDFNGAIECYNQSLKYKPRLSLAYQNKLLDVNYISHLIDDPMYIAKLHKNINKIYPKVVTNWKDGCPNYKINDVVRKSNSKQDLLKSKTKLRIGFVSGDFICHPVSYFIHSIFNYINYELFDVYCYSVKVVSLNDMFKNCKWFVVKNYSDVDLAELIKSHEIDVLFDLSAHTGDNRLDTFVLKPAPIQISYCGYPNSSGIRSMDYRITDKVCDSEKSQKYYQEKLIFMKKCFLAYTPSMGIDNIPKIENQPCEKNGYITFGCFNRYNKVNRKLISVWEKLLQKIPNARFVIKTKEFLTPKLRQQFIDSFTDKEVLSRVEILPYSDTYLEHLPDYNKMDIALDTFPYSGTTTSCESLMMGVPVLTLFDNIRNYHSQNVTSSLMTNSDLKEYVTYSEDEYINKAVYFSKNINKLKNLKKEVRNKFVNGAVCDYKGFVGEFEDTIINLYKNHKW
jgi:predicted O-linked N-acetylglucosamine transferase (SPINDLY family)